MSNSQRSRDIRIDNIATAFRVRFGETPACISSAPGRIIFAGEQLDYQLGLVLNTAIDARLFVALSLRADRKVVVESADFADPAPELQTIERFVPSRVGRARVKWWEAIHSLLLVISRLLESKYDTSLPGLSILIDSRESEGGIPVGVGLSSSAALEIAIIRGVLHLLGIEGVCAEDIAYLAKESEEAIGFFPGIQDQWSCLHSTPDGQDDQHVANLFDCYPRTNAAGKIAISSEPIVIPQELGMLVVRVRNEAETASERWRHNLWVMESEISAVLLSDLIGNYLGTEGIPLAHWRTYLKKEQSLRPGHLRQGRLNNDGFKIGGEIFEALLSRLPQEVALSDLLVQEPVNERLHEVRDRYEGIVESVLSQRLHPRRMFRYFFDESRRVRESARAFSTRNLHAFAHIQSEIHVGLGECYSIVNPAIDRMIAHLSTHPAFLGGRILGPGGGSNAVLWFVESDRASIEYELSRWHDPDGPAQARFLRVRPGNTAVLHDPSATSRL